METSQHVRLLQVTYAAQLADAVQQLDRAGVLEKVTEERRAARLTAGAAQAAQMGITAPAQAFTTSAELFGCADWAIVADSVSAAPAAEGAAGRSFTALAHHCLLCAMVKKAGGPSPCRLYCLDAMEAMVNGLAPGAAFDVQETLYDGAECRVCVAV